MENSDLSDGELTAAMVSCRRRHRDCWADIPQVNIALPGVPEPRDVEEQYKQRRYLEDGLLAKQCFAAPVSPVWGRDCCGVGGGGLTWRSTDMGISGGQDFLPRYGTK